MVAKLEDIVSLCKRRGFIFPGSDVYGGFAGTWDYGPLGVMLKKKMMNEWWKFWVDGREDIYGIDAAIIMNPKTWVASGHTATFADPLVECLECHGRFRADKLADGINESVTTEEFQALGTKCPTCKASNWGPIRKFNMMFETHVGPIQSLTSVQKLHKASLLTIKMWSIQFTQTCHLVLLNRVKPSVMRFLRVISFSVLANLNRWKLSIS